MIKDIKYIFKRIIIGVGIALFLSFLRGGLIADVHALEVYSFYSGGEVDVIDNTQWLTYYDFDNHWSSWGTGYIRFNFTVQKTAESTPSGTTPVITPRAVYVSTGNADFICDIGTVYTQNSTYNAQVYSAMCPVSFYDGGGLRRINIYFQDQQYNAQGQAKVSFDGHITFEKPSDSFDVSGIVNSANQNSQNIINNNNSNTDRIIQSQNDINNSLKDDNVDDANNQASSFFDNFQSSSHGLSGIVSAPLRLITSLSSSSCSSLVLPLPFVNQNAVLPCMSTIYNQFPTFYNLWQLITTGIIAYYILLRLFSKVHDLQNPNNDRIEVLNL